MAERRYTLLFYTAVLTAAVATYGVYRVLQKTKESVQVPMQPVVIAATDIREGERLERTSVLAKQWPAATVPESAFVTPDSVVGRVARVPVFKGEPIVEGRLAPAGTGPGIEVKIAPGKRAMVVKINDVAGLSGLIQPNSRVDVLVTLKEDPTGNKQRAKIFMSNMRVLSVGTQVERGDDGKPINATTAALEVTPAEAERLAVAMNQGTIQLVLRGFGDPADIATGGATSNDVLAQLRSAPEVRPDPEPAPRHVARHEFKPAPPPPPPPPAPVVALRPASRVDDSLVVRVYHGEKMTQQKFERTDSTAAPKP